MGNTLKVEYSSFIFNYREDTTDWGIIQQSCGGMYTKFFDVEPGELWLDFGAHIGSFSIYAASKGAEVIAFEPVPETYKLLVSNIKNNGFEKRITAVNKAVSNEAGKAQIFVNTTNFGASSIIENDPTKTIFDIDVIDAKTLSPPRNFCVKVDTEGCEYPIIKSLNIEKVTKLVFEYHWWLRLPVRGEECRGLQKIMEENFPHIEECPDNMHYAWR